MAACTATSRIFMRCSIWRPARGCTRSVCMCFWTAAIRRRRAPRFICIASMIGRYYAMDRDRRWQRVKSAYDLLTQGRAEFMAENALAGLEAAYARGETDEFVKATAILPADGKPVKMDDGDSVIFLNFRSDRARQLSRPFIEAD